MYMLISLLSIAEFRGVRHSLDFCRNFFDSAIYYCDFSAENSEIGGKGNYNDGCILFIM